MDLQMGTIQLICSSFLSSGWFSPENSWRR